MKANASVVCCSQKDQWRETNSPLVKHQGDEQQVEQQIISHLSGTQQEDSRQCHLLGQIESRKECCHLADILSQIKEKKVSIVHFRHNYCTFPAEKKV